MKDTNYNHGCRVISLSHNHGLVADIKDKWNELQERVESVDLEKGKLDAWCLSFVVSGPLAFSWMYQSFSPVLLIA